MRVLPIHGESGFDSWYGRVVIVPSEPDERFRLVDQGAVLIIDGAAKPPFVGTSVELDGVPYCIATQLPYQPNNDLLDEHLPPLPERPNARATGRYALHLMLEGGGSIITHPGAFEEFVPEQTEPER